MSFQLKGSICINCQTDKIVFLDKTGLYGDNGTGFGAPNIALGDVTLATLSIIYPNGTTAQVFDITADISDIVVNFLPVEKSPTDFGLTEFESGWGKCTYTVTGTLGGNSVTYTDVVEFFNACALECCVTKQAVKAAAETGSGCCDKGSQRALFNEMSTSLDILKKAMCCGNKDAVNMEAARLQSLCDTGGCGCS